MSEIDKQYQLNDNKQKTADNSKIEHHIFKGARWDIESAHTDTNQRQILEEPKAILDHRSRVLRTPHIEHQHEKEEKEASHRETDAVDRVETYQSAAVNVQNLLAGFFENILAMNFGNY